MKGWRALAFGLNLALMAGCAEPVPRELVDLPKKPTYRFYQRFAKNNYWDEGKPVPSEIGERLLRLLDGAPEWHPSEAPQYAAAWGLHAHPPAYVAQLDVLADGREEAYTFCYTLGLFSLRSKRGLYVVPEKSQPALADILNGLVDVGRGPLTR